jgi:hypothetical protein
MVPMIHEVWSTQLIEVATVDYGVPAIDDFFMISGFHRSSQNGEYSPTE